MRLAKQVIRALDQKPLEPIVAAMLADGHKAALSAMAVLDPEGVQPRPDRGAPVAGFYRLRAAQPANLARLTPTSRPRPSCCTSASTHLRDLPDFEALEVAALLSKEKLLAGDIPVGLVSGGGGEERHSIARTGIAQQIHGSNRLI